MAHTFPDLLTSFTVNHLLSLPAVVHAQHSLEERPQVDFYLDIPEDTRAHLSQDLGLPISSTVPMRWMRGDSMPHVDHSWDNRPYQKTFLVYLTDDKDGLFYVEDEEHPIVAGQGYRFDEGLVHGTRNTTRDRLLIGPFNERQVRVGTNEYVTYWRSVAQSQVIYSELTTSGALLSVEQINAINTNPSHPRHLEGRNYTYNTLGRVQIGWAFSASRSWGIGTLNGSTPVDGATYPINSAFVVDNEESSASIGLYPVFSEPPRRRRARQVGRGNWPPGRR